MIGAILAGGRATRLGGDDKGLQVVAGRTILARVVDVLGGNCHPIVLNANGDPARFGAFGLTVVADSLPDHPGPLAGVLAALDWAHANVPTTREIATVPADTPFLPLDLVTRLAAEHRRAGATLTCARSGGRRHPVAALWSPSLREPLRRALTEDGVRRMGTFLERQAVACVDWPSDPVDPFFNVNTPAELELANALAAEIARG